MKKPRVLIEDWLPAAAIGVECMRERGSASALAPHTFLHVWWARRPLAVSRAAVLGSLLPADFPRDVFERVLGFGRPGAELVKVRQWMDMGINVPGGFNCDRAFKNPIPEADLEQAQSAAHQLWGDEVSVIDPMSGGGSIPMESLRLGFKTYANEYNPVACSVLEATIDYPLRHGEKLGSLAAKWGGVLEERITTRLRDYFPKKSNGLVHAYIYARTVPCPNTGHATPLVPDWHLVKPKDGLRIVAVPVVDKEHGTWTIQVKRVGTAAGEIKEAPKPTYKDGKGVSIFDGLQISSDYIKAMAQQGRMKSHLYAVAVKTPQGLQFYPPERADLLALGEAERELNRLRPVWERNDIIPTEMYPEITTDHRPRTYGMPRWADLFSSRQLLCMGTLVDELEKMRDEIIAAEGEEMAQAVIHLLAFCIDKFINYNSVLCSWHAPRQVMRSVFDRHDFSFKSTFAEMAPCQSGAGLAWAIGNALDSYGNLASLPASPAGQMVSITQGSASQLPGVPAGSISAVVVDPPYADNVQYSELADFFYVWLKRMTGHQHPDWFSTYLCEHDEEAVVNAERHLKGKAKKKLAKVAANEFYNKKMAEVFSECRRILRDDGVLTVMFTHKKQEAWEGLFDSLIKAGFSISATWPVKTESEHSLHQAKKNAAQSTVLLVARKRDDGAGVGIYNSGLRDEIIQAARKAAVRLRSEGLNSVDQLVGSFGPAMEVFSRYDEVMTDTGVPVKVGEAIDLAAEAVSSWRVEQLSASLGGLEGVEAEGRFALLCWDVLGAAEFRFNEAKLLGHAVGMDVVQLEVAGLVTKSGDKINILSAKDRRRDKPLEADKIEETLFGPIVVPGKRRKKADALKVHPNDPRFRTALDACHALALRFTEAANERAGVGSARQLMNQQGWTKESAVAKLMAALVNAAPEAVRHHKKKNDAAELFPEFRAWYLLMQELFGFDVPDWTEAPPPQMELELSFDGDDEDEFDLEDEEDTDDDDEDESKPKID